MAVLKMKELESRSGFNREAIRFYIREGILPQPEKPKKNVALYSDEHLVKLKLIRKIQDEKFLPLREIKSLLKNADLSQLSANSDLAEFEVAFHTIVEGKHPEQDLTLAAVSRETGFTLAELEELDANGTIALDKEKSPHMIRAEDVAILRNWAQVMSLGYKPADGFDFALLQRYADSVRDIAELELDLFLAAYGNLPTNESAQMGASGMELSSKLLQQFHTRAINQALKQRVAGISND